MNNLDLIGNLILLLGIITSGVLFICVNINYQPNEESDESKKED